MDSEPPRNDELEQTVRDLSARVDRIETHLQALISSSSDAERTVTPIAQPARPQVPQPPPPRNRAPNLESRIGAQWLNRVGIIAVLIGVSFFLKYAFEAEWIGASGRILIGIVGGIALIAWSEWFRVHGYKIFSLSLKALGLGILYLSLWAVFQVYELIVWQAAFAGMLIVTASTAALSLWQKAEILALFALVGGFATPILLYTPENRALQLFAYITLLNAATLFMAASRAWRRLLLFSMLASFVLFFFWYVALYQVNQRGLALAFTTLFFGIFASAPLFQPASETLPGSGFVLITSALNGLGYFLELYLLLGRNDDISAALCAIALAGVYLALSEMLRRRSGSGATLPRLHLVLSLVFLTAAIAIYFESYWISIAWFIEAAVLMAIGFGRKSAFVRWQALALIAPTIAKVFVLDIWRLDRGYRILSFVLLGMLLLAVSFVYQRDWLKLSLGADVQSEG
jgi:uncharacterized membrane protein